MRKIFNLILVLLPILSGYGFSVTLDFGSIAVFAFGILCFLESPKFFKIRFPNGYLLFFVVALLLSLLFAKNLPLRLILFSVNLCFACSYADFDLLWKYYGKVVWLCCAFFIIQEAVFIATGVRLNGMIPFLPTVYGVSGARYMDVVTNLRANTFFLEPSYLAQYLIPYTVCIFSNDKQTIKKAIIVSVVVLLVRSGMGVMALSIVWLIWTFSSNIKVWIKISVLALALSFLGVLFFTNSSVLGYISNRSAEMTSYGGTETYQSSGFVRFYRGYYVLAEIPLENKIFGTNPNDVEDIISKSKWFLLDDDRFLNGVQTLLLYHGIIGAFLYLRHVFLFLRKRRDKMVRVLTICMLAFLIGESYYLSSRSFLMTIFLYLMVISPKNLFIKQVDNYE